MSTYVIFYNYTDDGGYEWRNCQDTFYGTFSQLQECIAGMREQGCYNIDASEIYEPEEDDYE